MSKVHKFNLYVNIILFTFAFLFLFPIFWILLTSIKPEPIILKFPPVFFSFKPTFHAYIYAYTKHPVFQFVLNSFIAASISSMIAVILSVFSSYAFSRYQFKFKKFFMVFVLIPMMIPAITNLIPLFRVFSKLKLIDTYLGLIILYIPALIPFSVWVIKAFIDGIPVSMEESASIDGCSSFKTIIYIIMPLTVPCTLAVFIINFITRWNEFFAALLFTNTDKMRTLPVGIYNFLGSNLDEYGPLFATTIGSIIIPVGCFILIRDKFINAMITGAIKG